MSARLPLAVVAALAAAAGFATMSLAAEPAPPVARVVAHAETLHGEVLEDPYHWLRDRDDPEVIRHLEAENAWTKARLAHTEPLQQQLYDEMLSRLKEDDVSPPARDGEWWYYTRTDKGKSYPIWCRRRGGAAGPEGPEQVVLDGNALAEGHGYFKLASYRMSPDHRLAAFVVDYTGAEDYVLRVRDLESGELLADQVPHVFFTCEWAADGRTLFYPQHDASWRPERIRRHVLGTDPATDAVVLTEPDPTMSLDLSKSRDDRWLVIESGGYDHSEVRLLPADEPTATPRLVEPRRPGVLYDVTPHGDELWIHTNDGALDFRVVRAPIATPGREHWRDLVPHRPGVLVESIDGFAGHLVLWTRRDGLQRLEVLRLADGVRHEVAFDEPIYALASSSNFVHDTGTYRFAVSSPVTPSTVIDYDLEARSRVVVKRTEVPNVDPTRYATTRAWARAADGARIPISLLHARDAKPDTPRPLVLYAYGAYGLSSDPGFSANLLGLIDRGAVYAIAHVRGGQEMGRGWYEDGRLARKQNTFTDFIACAEHLVATGWTTPSRLAIRGGSAGGLLVGACVTMEPRQFKAAVAEVPFVDVVTTMSDPSLPLTVTEWEEWGDPRAEPFASYMLSYSPYDNTRPGDYPALYITAGLNDPRVSYHEPAKWAAKLRDVRTDASQPLLLRTEMGAGHAGPSGRYDAWRDEARVLSFLVRTL